MTQNQKIEKTVVTVKLKSARQKGKPNSWALILRSYPIIEDGKRKAKLEFLNRVVTTPVWDKAKKMSKGNGLPYHVKRDSNGIIICESEVDQESCLYADQVRKLRQHEYDVAHIYEGHEEEVEEKEKSKKEDFFSYFQKLNEQRHPDPNSSSYRFGNIL